MLQRLAIGAIGLATIGGLLACSATKSPGEETGTATAAQTVTGGPHLLWQNTTSGLFEAWLLNGNQVTGSVTDYLSSRCGTDDGCVPDWQVIDTGRNVVMWWNQSTGQVSTWAFEPDGAVTIEPNLPLTCGLYDGCDDDSHV